MERISFIMIMPLAFSIILLPWSTAAPMPPTKAQAHNPNTKAQAQAQAHNPNTKAQAQAQAQNPNTKAQGPNPLIDKACSSALHKDLCIQTLKSQPGSGTADVKGLAFMSLNITKAYGSTIATWINDKLDDDSLGPGIEQALTDCLDQYTDALAQLEDSMAAFFDKGGYKDINTWISAAMANADTCEDGLKGANAGDVLANKNTVFIQYCSNALATVNVLSKQ